MMKQLDGDSIISRLFAEPGKGFTDFMDNHPVIYILSLPIWLPFLFLKFILGGLLLIIHFISYIVFDIVHLTRSKTYNEIFPDYVPCFSDKDIPQNNQTTDVTQVISEQTLKSHQIRCQAPDKIKEDSAVRNRIRQKQ